MTRIIKTYNNFMSNSTPENWFSIHNLFLRHIVNNKARRDLNLCVLRDCYDKYVDIKFIRYDLVFESYDSAGYKSTQKYKQALKDYQECLEDYNRCVKELQDFLDTLTISK